MLALSRKANGGSIAMQGTRDIDETPTADDGDGLDPVEAARLLAQTKRDAKRQFNLSPPWVTASGGVSGPSLRQQRVEGVAILISYLGSPVIQGAMKHYGASHAIVYGVIPAAGPLIIVGTTVLGIAGSKADWPQFGAALTVVIAGTVALFVGPSAAWLAAGIGLCIAVAGYAAATGKRLGRA